ncbi:MAG: sulfatase [Anaerolineae bacterium]|nr:sulfatase [Anaerolineae bacterium]
MAKTSQQDSHPDIVFILLDTMRADRLSCYDFGQETTPHLDAFAAGSIVFDQAISPAQWTIPAHGSLFTGEYPTTHGTTQIFDRHSKDQVTLAEILHGAGYLTVGFCNNPLLGVVENDLDRGFEAFYNYGGLLADRPRFLERRPHPIEQLYQWLVRQIRSLNQPIQDLFTHNDVLLGIALHPWLVPLWERNINFKGNTRQSIKDFVAYLRTYQAKRERRPIFTYLNLMETHLPYAVPAHFSRKFAPTFHQDGEASAFLRDYNHRTFDWIAPITKPFTDQEHRVLNEMYNAEVAYEDFLLAPLYDYLNLPEIRDNTVVIISADHGEGLDHHGYVGHSLVTYEDLTRVPLITRFPGHATHAQRIATPVSTRRIFHTVLQTAHMHPEPAHEALRAQVQKLSLVNDINDQPPEKEDVFTEAFSPLTLVKLIEGKDPTLVEQFRCLATRRAIYNGPQKLITVDDRPEELYDIAQDPSELDNRIADFPDLVDELDARLQHNLEIARTRRHHNGHDSPKVNVHDNSEVADRLRQLGYIE